MTSARRAARAAAGGQIPAAVPPADLDVLEVIGDPSARVWHDGVAYLALVAAHGWDPCPPERMQCRSHPENRRLRAAIDWGRAHGLDLHRLRERGVLGTKGKSADD